MESSHSHTHVEVLTCEPGMIFPLGNSFLWWPKIQATLCEHEWAGCWTVNVWLWILVAGSCWALRLLIFCDLASELSCSVCSEHFCVVSMTFRYGTFNKSKVSEYWFSPSSGKYEQKLVCPFWIKCCISAVHFSFHFSVCFHYMYLFMCNFL